MSRGPFKPTKEQSVRVTVLVACGTPQSEIVRQVINPETGKPIDLKTLRRCFRFELDEGMQAANAIVARALFKRATGDGPQSVTAAIFWLKAKAGWRDVPAQDEDRLDINDAAVELQRIASASRATAAE